MPRSFYEADVLDVGPRLLNKLFARGEVVGRIVEVEAYRGDEDAASHAYRGRTRRNATMFGPPGRLYVYFTYGMHWCANVVCGPTGVAHAVLLRALAPVSGVEQMRAARGGMTDERNLASGPAKLCQAMGVTGRDDGSDLVTGDRGFVVLDDGTPAPSDPGTSSRVGIRNAVELPWRWWVRDDPNVSRARLSDDGRRRRRSAR